MTQISSSRLLSSALTALGAIAEVLVPGDDGYAGTAATLFADGTPDLVVRPLDAAGVAAALRYAADAGLAVTVRSGGHSMAGLSTSADGMIIDTRRISGVRLLDPASGRVRVGAGATWGAVAAALSPLGLGLTAGDTNQVGVGGLTLGGGIGWMVRRHGLAIDSLAAAQVVTADGRLIGAALSLRSLGGAAARVSRDATAFAHRDAEVMVAAAFLLPQPAPPGLLHQALNRWSRVAALGSGAYVGFLGSADPADVAAAYPPDTYRRLAAVKRRYDPGNVFRRTHNILPGRS